MGTAIMQTLPISVYVITLNEEKNIGRLLSQLTMVDEIVLVDSGSTDQTVGIARRFPNVTVYYRQWTGFSDQKNYALGLCRNEWVMNLDADEEIGPGYLEAAGELLENSDADALQSRRILYRHGRKPRNFFKDDTLVRFFRKSCGRYAPARVHEKLVIDGRIKTTDAVLLHHENLSFSQRVRKSNQYSELKAQDKFDQGRQASFLILLLVFPFSFLRCYLIKGCLLDGCDGILTSMNHAYYNFMKYAKLWELNAASRRSTPQTHHWDFNAWSSKKN